MLAKTLLILIALIALAVPVAASLGWLGLTLQYLESPMPLHRALGDMVWQTGTDFLLVAIPMFVLLGEILLRAGITERMYEGIVRWVGWLPGGLMHSNIGSSALFAATSGSSVATAATIGTVAVPQIEKRGYNEPLFLGTIAAGGTLGGQGAPGDDTPAENAGTFKYTKEVLAGNHAVLEFETEMNGKYVNGVDIITCNDEGKITEFRVMIRPLQAVNAVHAAMGAMLEKMKG